MGKDIQPSAQEAALSPEEQLAELAANLGFVETDDLAALRAQIPEHLLVAPEAARQTVLDYEVGAMELVDQSQGREYTSAQIGCVIALATAWKAAGREDRYAADIDKALTMAENQGFDIEAEALRSILEQLQLATPVETISQSEPTVQEVIDACSEVLTEDDLAFMHDMPFEEALGYVYGSLLENGVEDPDSYLREKGILE